MLSTKEQIKKSLALVIPSAATQDHNLSDLEKLMASHIIIEQAQDAFLNQEISVCEYFDLCAKHEVNVDSYLESIEHNLNYFGLT